MVSRTLRCSFRWLASARCWQRRRRRARGATGTPPPDPLGRLRALAAQRYVIAKRANDLDIKMEALKAEMAITSKAWTGLDLDYQAQYRVCGPSVAAAMDVEGPPAESGGGAFDASSLHAVVSMTAALSDPQHLERAYDVYVAGRKSEGQTHAPPAGWMSAHCVTQLMLIRAVVK